MDVTNLIADRYNNLLREGQGIFASAGWDGRKFPNDYPSNIDYLRFRTEAMNLIRRSCGENSDHYIELRRYAESDTTTNNSFFFPHCYGILQAAKRDFEGGLLFAMRDLIAAELLGDFIEQSEVLLAAGYYAPAASLAGAVLEDTLRKLCDKHGIAIEGTSKIDKLNASLARGEVYDKLIQKRITAIADIRNNADHGNFEKFTPADVEDMIKWIRSFAADRLR